jgi:hypothetical protein
MKTIAQQLSITDFPFVINDKNGNETYSETSYGDWWKTERDANGRVIRFENSNGYWYTKEYDDSGKEVYIEDTWGVKYDNRPKTVEVTLQQIADKFGIKVEQLGIKDCLILTTLKLI